jgi:hypothetical protein
VLPLTVLLVSVGAAVFEIAATALTALPLTVPMVSVRVPKKL